MTSADAGDVLTVNESGAWAKGAAPSGLPTPTSDDKYHALMVNSQSGAEWLGIAETFPAEYSSSQNTVSADIDFAALFEAVQANRPVGLYVPGAIDNAAILWLTDYNFLNPAHPKARFGGMVQINNASYYMDVLFESADNVVSSTLTLFVPVPAYDPVQDIGKSLKVGANGLEWAQ